MTMCEPLTSGAVELYFYGELGPAERKALDAHLGSCANCRRALEELSLIRTALSTRPVIDSPPQGNWQVFMERLDEAIRPEDGTRQGRVVPFAATAPPPYARPSVSYAPYVAIAALLTLVTMSLVYMARAGVERAPDAIAAEDTAPAPVPASRASKTESSSQMALARLSEQHFERSKLVVLGLASKDPRSAKLADWEYERQLASDLLTDTRLYRMAAEEHGMKSLAHVMADLELVLLQTSLAEQADSEDLEQIQRLIQKRDLVTKMDVVGTTGL